MPLLVRRLVLFQSTLPVRGATGLLLARLPGGCYFNPRSPCGERQRYLPDSGTAVAFQSTLPVRGATAADIAGGEGVVFQSTLPVRGATSGIMWAAFPSSISIHAPRAGSDAPGQRHPNSFQNFNPRSPCGERHPRWVVKGGWAKISIHAPRAGSDDQAQGTSLDSQVFQSTLPVRGATFRPSRLG